MLRLWLLTIELDQVVCAKVREGDKRTVWVKEGNPSSFHVVIVYDLVQSGGTLIECQVLFQHNVCLLICFTRCLVQDVFYLIPLVSRVFVDSSEFTCAGPKNKKIVIITIIMLLLQKVLAAHGATKVSAYVTHAVFPKNSWKKFVHKNGGLLNVDTV
ncbi:putative ribose-phosphate diphosphokinase [Helianthus annuus]|nr:putative ribose-phosphate diphosphokinase [Helianthus annuus]KAJ0644115.1 putative ribose-phosphate diphosphokinase [Helianthus annuus]